MLTAVRLWLLATAVLTVAFVLLLVVQSLAGLLAVLRSRLTASPLGSGPVLLRARRSRA